MGIKKNIIKILLLALWIVLGSGVLVLLVAAINVKNRNTCKGIDIRITGVKEYFFLSEQDIIKIISSDGEDKPEGKIIAGFNLQKMEALLEKNVWVKDAELFFDNNLMLHINIMEKEPVARIFTTSGYSFYIDSSGDRMPLNDKLSVRLPVFTGFPADKVRLKSADSLLMEHIKIVSNQILNDSFWMAQIAQVAITPDRNFEMIPTIGSHIIQFGNGEDCASKFRRLYIFYSQVLSKAGFDKYSRISVQYDKQVIGTKKGIIAKVDSVQALKNIRKMIEEARKVYDDSIYIPVETISALTKADSVSTLSVEGLADTTNTKKPVAEISSKKSNVPPKKSVPEKKASGKLVREVQKPKAVMKRVNGQW